MTIPETIFRKNMGDKELEYRRKIFYTEISGYFQFSPKAGNKHKV